MTEAQERFLKESCPMLGKDPQFANAYLKSSPLDGVYLSITYKAYSSSGLNYCNLMVQVAYGITLSSELDSNLTAHVDAVKNNCNKGFESVSLQLPLSCSFPDHPRVVFVIPLQGRYRAMERFMERYEKDFLMSQNRLSFGFSGFPIVQLVIVLLRGGNDDLGLNDAASNLLKGYQDKYGPDHIRYHVANTGGRAFSRGAGKRFDMHVCFGETFSNTALYF